MKLQNLSVIFVIIVLPLILLLSYYISLQIDTINLQTAYDSKLLDSTKEAIDAFEINTVEWNPNYSEVADSKRRDVMASINTFITSFSNNIGIGGTSRENILSYMPSIVYTLYDGYYIYSAADVKPTIVNDNGVAITIDEDLCKKNEITGYIYNKSDNGKLLYQPAGGDIDGYYRGQAFTLDSDKAVGPEYKHILKPFSPYSEKIEGTNLVINYTLDNYITIYGEVENEAGNKEYVSKSGYLTKPDKIGGITHNSVSGIEFNEKTIEPEILEEQIAYKDDLGNMQVDSFIYVYEKGNTKVYYDNTGTTDSIGNRFYFFRLDTDNKRIWVNEASNLYKKCTVPRYNSGEWTYLELYQDLGNGNWYTTNDGKNYEIKYNVGDSLPSGMSYDLRYDYSAINYCTESWLFTNWYNQIVKEAIGTTDNQYYIKSTNDPEVESSAFCLNKGEVIKQVVNSDLQQSISSYSRNTPNEYRIPELTEEDWNQILRNASIITFIQNIPIGMKYYNNYAIATSTVNKEYVDPNEIYLNTTGDTYYHMPYCSSLTENNLIGYRRIDYIQKSYNIVNTPTPIKKYYYRHSDNENTNKDVEEACYNCLIQKSEYEEDKTDLKEKAYYTALVRERYIARMTKLPPEIEPGYLLHVEMVNSEAASQKLYPGESSYSIDGDLYNFETFIKIKKESSFPKTYKIEAVNEGEIGGGTAPTPTTDTGNLNSPKNTINTELTETPTYVSDSKINVTINNYDTTGIQITYSGYQNVEWGSGETSATYDNITPNSISSDVGTGYVNVKLKYKPNYSVNETTKKVKAWANINDYNNLTIVTETTGITGKVRLAFVNNGVVYYYSEDTFDISEGAKIYCKIPGDGLEGDTRWYSHDWEVRVITTNNDLIASGTVEYYTIKDSSGLKGFAQATNDGAKTEGRKFYLINDIDMDGSNLNPICQSTFNWFNGYFSGAYNEGLVKAENNHVISNINIAITENTSYAFGLFGWVGNPAKIEDLVISNIKVDLSSITNKVDYKAGGLAGFCDVGESINNVTVTNSNIKGTAYVGGIAGESKKEILNSNVISTSIQSIGHYTNASNNNIYVGGITGKSNAKIEECEVDSGEKYIKYAGNKDDWKLTNAKANNNDMNMYVGGIAGELNSEAKNCNVAGNIGSNADFNKDRLANIDLIDGNIDYACVNYFVGGYAGKLENNGYFTFNDLKDLSNNLKVNGGLVTNDNNEYYKSYTGGLVGYNNGNREISGIINEAPVSSEGYNTGGIVGYNNGRNISNCINKGTIKGKGNVGGIAGWTRKGYIYSCGNTGKIEGENNINLPVEIKFLGIKLGQWWFATESQECTGTGGIVGKVSTATISQSYNNGSINCNYNGGGIIGIDVDGTVKYSYNSGKITANEYGRVGGICGASVGIDINSSYNIGSVSGKVTNFDAGRLTGGIQYGVGGLVGVSFCNDFRYENNGGWYKLEDGSWKKLNNYEVGAIPLPIIIDNIEHPINISYCYNAAESVTGGYKAGILKGYRGAITGYGFYVRAYGEPKYIYNYYLKNNSELKGINYEDKSSEYEGIDEGKFQEQLYKWANDLTVPSDEDSSIAGKYTYNTTAPVENELGYKGYGILWWQLEDYGRTTFHVVDDVGVPIYPPTLYINSIEKYLDTENYRNYSCNEYGNNITTYGYILMLDNSKTYKFYATAEKYKDREPEKTVNIGEVNHISVGKRPEFIFAKANNNNNTNSGYTGTIQEIPQGEYYVIAKGGGGSGPKNKGLAGFKLKNGGGSGATYIARINLSGTYKYTVGYGGHMHDISFAKSGYATILENGSGTMKIKANGGITRRRRESSWRSTEWFRRNN